MSPTFTELCEALELEFASSASDDAWSDDRFEARALDVFRLQYEGCAPFRALCDARGVLPHDAGHWTEVPLVPTSAFKQLDMVSAEVGAEGRIFRTSGTTRGHEARGRHHVPRPSLYRAALLPPFRSALVPDGQRLRFVSLIPSPDQVTDSSLSFMVGAAADALATSIDWLVDADGRWAGSAGDVWADVRARGEPVLLLGTALAFLHAIERGEPGRGGLGVLPEGSRIMETGGFKGAGRDVSRAELYRVLAERTDTPEDRIVNEYGMTELLSQLWEPVLREGAEAGRSHVPAPWLRVRALDPVTLAPVPEGSDGLLAFFDLANVGSVSHVLTEDIGSVVGGRVRLRGRAPGAEPRGCSRAMDQLMSAARR